MHILGIPDNYIDVKVSFGVIRNPSFGMMDDDWGSKKNPWEIPCLFFGG